MAVLHVNAPDTNGLVDREIEQLQQLLDDLPEPLQPLDVSALDGFLCGVLLQPNTIDVARWMPYVTDVDGRVLLSKIDTDALHGLIRRRFTQLAAAIDARQWFDPWVFELDLQTSPSANVLPWVAGFAAAMDRFPDLLRIDDPQLLEPLALIYMHFDPDDLEDSDALQELISTLEPPTDLGEAVQDIVRSLMLIADVVRPRAQAPVRKHRRRTTAARKPR
jgi:uncharacterized protein